ncbi:MFS transporter [Amycolatopsis suaedae]|uniref:MFS transporter n=1 Tax=Amycolatopsis suaedae TaxID=2510978 RepID=A0A4Q7J0M2_9PSEU|nr:MFS transporter [Amycolatopsis suaedae]
MTRPQRMALVGALYLVSNIGYSFLFMTLGTILLGRGVPLGTVAAINLLGMVYFGRFLMAPVVDRTGHYRRWLIGTQLALVATLVTIAWLDPADDLAALLGLLVVVLVLSLFHDAAMNGLVVRILPESDHGSANGMQVASAAASILIGSSGALLLYSNAGWTVTLLALAAVYAVPLLVLRTVTEPAATGTVAEAPWRTLAGYFASTRRTLWALVIIPLFGAGAWLGTAGQPAMLLGAGWPMDRIAVVQSVGTTAQLLTALVAGAVLSRVGSSRFAAVAGASCAVATAGLLPLAAGDGSFWPTAAAMVTMSAAYGAQLTWIATVSMGQARRSAAATDYTVPMSIEAVYVTVINSAGLWFAATAGFTWLLVVALGIAAAGAVVAPLWTGWARRRATVGLAR